MNSDVHPSSLRNSVSSSSLTCFYILLTCIIIVQMYLNSTVIQQQEIPILHEPSKHKRTKHSKAELFKTASLYTQISKVAINRKNGKQYTCNLSDTLLKKLIMTFINCIKHSEKFKVIC